MRTSFQNLYCGDQAIRKLNEDIERPNYLRWLQVVWFVAIGVSNATPDVNSLLVINILFVFVSSS